MGSSHDRNFCAHSARLHLLRNPTWCSILIRIVQPDLLCGVSVLGCGRRQTSTSPVGDRGYSHHKVGPWLPNRPWHWHLLQAKSSQNCQPCGVSPRIRRMTGQRHLPCHVPWFMGKFGSAEEQWKFSPLYWLSCIFFFYKTPPDVWAGFVVRCTPGMGWDVLRSSNFCWAHGAPSIFVVEWRSPPQVSFDKSHTIGPTWSARQPAHAFYCCGEYLFCLHGPIITAGCIIAIFTSKLACFTPPTFVMVASSVVVFANGYSGTSTAMTLTPCKNAPV